MTVTIAPTEDVDACIALRIEVFVGEQGIPMEEEIDDLDDVSTHLLATDETGAPVGTARVYEQGEIGKIGRVCVAKSQRGTGLGAKLVQACVDELRSRNHLSTAKLSAQTYAIGFYEKVGFEAVGEEYPDAGIPHKDMVMPL
ncbi:GNAT family N-acetyltransferase [Celeribacter litoreus]|uniref:GNAT family N-acetyltransferase n=1 Tax=Celeribacter litoreus TaxID=2876714 RepID=UPI001CCCD23E|nr:GNAT family N-acetyltransferase [Celeribacter litoreus]MCA0042035.1 GNAT family N-acetyltransferase [Celeribacter litoreus]